MTREHLREYKSGDLLVQEIRGTNEKINCRYRRRYANNGNKTVEKPMQRKSRESLRRLKPIVGCNASKRKKKS